MSDPRCSRERDTLPSFLVRDRNGCTDRLARDSGQENRQARPGLRTCLWPWSGLFGDEVGLLLTFGNYYSELTYQVFVGVVGLIILRALAIRFGERLVRDFMRMERWDAVGLVGLFLAGFSTLFFAFVLDIIGASFALLGSYQLSGGTSIGARCLFRLRRADSQ